MGLSKRIVTLSQRFETGMIATLVGDDVVTAKHFVGEGMSALADIIDFCDRHSLKVRCLSTPDSIYRDLQGSRAQRGTSRKVDLSLPEAPEVVRYPEQAMLGKWGRADLFEKGSHWPSESKKVRRAS